MPTLLAFLFSCVPGYEPPEAACLRVEVTPEVASLAAVPGAVAGVDLALCGCASPSPCPEEALVPGRVLTLAAERGFVEEASIYLPDGRGRTTFQADGTVGLGTVTATTTEGYSGGAVIRLDPPLELGVDAIDLYPGVPAYVPVSGAVSPVSPPAVLSSVAIDATWDDAVSALLLSTDTYVSVVTTGIVTLTDAAGQIGTLSLTVQPGTPYPEEVTLAAADRALPADGLSTSVVTVTADVPDGTAATLFTTLGSFASADLVLVDGVATGLFVAGDTPGQATLQATVGSVASAPLTLSLE
jgi:hypothetical protein